MNERMSKATDLSNVDFGKLANYFKNGNKSVVPATVQDANTGEVLVTAYVNLSAVEESIRQRTAVFWSTSRNELWVKGATSGNFLKLLEIRLNCEENSFLFLVDAPDPFKACHRLDGNGEKYRSCFFRQVWVARER